MWYFDTRLDYFNCEMSRNSLNIKFDAKGIKIEVKCEQKYRSLLSNHKGKTSLHEIVIIIN